MRTVSLVFISAFFYFHKNFSYCLAQGGQMWYSSVQVIFTTNFGEMIST